MPQQLFVYIKCFVIVNMKTGELANRLRYRFFPIIVTRRGSIEMANLNWSRSESVLFARFEISSNII